MQGFDTTVGTVSTDKQGHKHHHRYLSAMATRTEAVARWLWVQGHGDMYGRDLKPQYARPEGDEHGRWKAPPVDWLATRTESMGRWLTGPPFSIYQGSAYDLAPPTDAREWVVFIDPPYVGTSGYKSNLPREQVIEIAKRWSRAGALVCISEAVPIQIAGWYHLRIDHARRGQKRTFGATEEWLTMNRPPVAVPGEQARLW
jgi:hypothetical protein